MAETYELKAKLVFSGTAKDAEAAMKPIKDYFDRHPVKLPFGVDEAATAAQINASLGRIVNGRLDLPKVKLEAALDATKLTAQAKAVSEKALAQTGGTGAASKGMKAAFEQLDKLELKLKSLRSNSLAALLSGDKSAGKAIMPSYANCEAMAA